MPKKLRRLQILEGSLVPAGANPGAKILLYKSAAAEIDSILREEPAEAQAALIEETLRWAAGFEEHEDGTDIGSRALSEKFAACDRWSARYAVPVTKKEDREMQQTSELSRMLTFAQATDGAAPHGWSDEDVYAAMVEKAQQLAPDLPPEVALAKSWGHTDVQRLYALYRVAEAEVAPEVVEKVAGSPAWNEIEARAELLRKSEPRLSQPQAIAAIMDRHPDLYARYRSEQG